MNDNLSPRSLAFTGRKHNRYWWFNMTGNDYVPPCLQRLSEDEWKLLNDWYVDTEEKFESPGELGVPGISFLEGLIGGNGITRVVQCGHYVGFSSLMLGFIMRSMGKKHSIFSIDLLQVVTDYTDGWLQKANLVEYVKLCVKDSSDSSNPAEAAKWLGGAPQVVFIDSSHQYAHTLKELHLWYDALAPGGFIVMHDVSIFAETFDPTKGGGVRTAVQEWSKERGVPLFLMNQFVDGSKNPNELIYKDGCGMGLIQKPAAG